MARGERLSESLAPGTANAGNARISGEHAIRIVYGLVFVAATGLVAVPIAALIYGSFRSGAPGQRGEWTIVNWIGVAGADIIGTLVNTLIVAGGSALASTVFGTLFAWIVYRTDFRYRRSFTVLASISFVLPGFILAMAWIILGSPGGIVNTVLGTLIGAGYQPFDIYSLGGIVWILSLHLIPITFFTVRGPLQAVDAGLEEAASIAGARPLRVIVRITLPLMSYPILSSFLLAFVLAIEQFAIPALVGIPGHVNVLASELYLLVSFEPPKPGLAAAIGLALTIATGVALFCQRRIAARKSVATVSGKSYRQGLVMLGRWRWLANLACFAFMLAGCVAPLVALVYTSLTKYSVVNPFAAAYTLRAYASLFSDPSTGAAFLNTLIVAGGGALLALVIGALVAYFLHRAKLRGSRVMAAISAIAFGVPGVVVGLGFLWSYVYLPIYGTLLALILCYVARFLPYATETVSAQLVQIDRSLDEAAATAGAPPLFVIGRILLPLLGPALQSAFFLLFVTFFREVAAAALLYTPSTEVISIRIWTYFENADWGRASALSLVATAIILCIMGAMERLRNHDPAGARR